MSREQSAEAAGRALDNLVTEIAAVIRELESACERARDLQEQRSAGRSWYEIVADEERPLIVEQISAAMGTLAGAGGRWRRSQAQALHDENVSINRIAELYGVTRQRVSALLRNGEQAVPAER